MIGSKVNAFKTLLGVLCISVVFVIFCSIAGERFYLPTRPFLRRVSSIWKDKVYKKTFPAGPFAKLFAYYILTEKCLPAYYLESVALGDSSRCDVFVNSYKEKCDSQSIPKHITYVFKSTTWSTGRNLLYYYVKETRRRYNYHIFLDDDAIPIHTDHVIRFRKKFPNADSTHQYVESEKGFKEGIYWEKEGQSAWRLFEDDLLRQSPSFAVSNYIQNSREIRLRVQSHWKEVCAKGKEMPWIVPTFYLDELFVAYHEEAMPMLFPYATMFEHISWWASGILHIFRARALLYRSGIANYKVTVINNMHRPYPRGTIPSDFLSQYLAGDGKDMKGLFDEKEMDWKNFDSWWKFETAFIHTKAICTVPLKFPVSKNYALRRL